MTDLSRAEIQKFIDDHIEDDIHDLVLKYSGIGDVSIGEIASQIKSKKKAKGKLPTWFKCKGLIYPPPISLEQCSSEVTASFKASLYSGDCALDLTGGMGVDSFFLNQSFKSVDYVEKDEALVEIARHNFDLLEVSGITCQCSLGEEFLDNTDINYDLIYIDPSRRVFDKKVFKLTDCLPDVIDMQEGLLKRCKELLIKTSPLLDIRKTLNDLKDVNEVIVLSVKNEVKEVLYRLSNVQEASEPLIRAVNITSNPDIFEFTLSCEEKATPQYSKPVVSDYLYEPNSSILKAGAFKLSATHWGLKKLHPNTHIYTSNKLLSHFPGRIFKVTKSYPSASSAKNELKGSQMNVIVRNFPLRPELLKMKLNARDGGEKYLLATTVEYAGKQLFYCNRTK